MELLKYSPALSIPTVDNNQLTLVAQNLDIGYNSTPIIKDIHLHLSWGQTIALVGMNGSGTVSYTHLTLPTIYSV